MAWGLGCLPPGAGRTPRRAPSSVLLAERLEHGEGRPGLDQGPVLNSSREWKGGRSQAGGEAGALENLPRPHSRISKQDSQCGTL